jgi:hypothetical protein
MIVFGYFLKLNIRLGSPNIATALHTVQFKPIFPLPTDFIRTFFVAIRTEIAGFRP